MTLMQHFGFDADDLEANQQGRLSPRQQIRMPLDARDPSGSVRVVRRITGLVSPMISEGEPHLLVNDVAVALRSADLPNHALEPTRLYTLYVAECGGELRLLSIEEGPDWSGGGAKTSTE